LDNYFKIISVCAITTEADAAVVCQDTWSQWSYWIPWMEFNWIQVFGLLLHHCQQRFCGDVNGIETATNRI